MVLDGANGFDVGHWLHQFPIICLQFRLGRTLQCIVTFICLDDATSKVQPLSSSAKVMLVSDPMSPAHTDTQDSIINDSGFLPGTPPSKKVLSLSLSLSLSLCLLLSECVCVCFLIKVYLPTTYSSRAVLSSMTWISLATS